MDDQELAFERLAVGMKAKLNQYIADRAMLEQQWLVNLRQFRGVYDQSVLDLIPANKSKAYPRDTRTKVKGFVAKMMEMMFPAQERNWDLVTSPFPSLPREVITKTIDTLKKQMEEQQRATMQGQDPAAPPPAPVELTDEQIEEAIKVESDKRRDRMRKLIEDQLADKDVKWTQICKRVVRSGSIYGAGFVRSPVVRTQTERKWRVDPLTGTYEGVSVKEKRPFPEFVKVWDIYPDLSADDWNAQEGLFERLVFTRATLRDLRDRPNFKKKLIDEYLLNHQTGNYTVRTFEAGLHAMNNTTIDDKNRKERRYEVYRWVGFNTGHDLAAAGVEVPEDKLAEVFLSDIWMLDDLVIFAQKAAFGDRPSDYYHAYIYAEDEEAGLTGVGLPEELRDRQMSLCAGTRAMYDNMAACAGPIYEVAVDLLKRGVAPTNVSAFSVIEREGDGPELAYPAVRAINTDSHVAELLSILEKERAQFDIESNLPSWMFGNPQPLGEAFRTSSNMSQMTGGGNMVTKDSVRGFDLFVASVINSILQWNMEFGTDEEAKGDYQVQAKGVESLVAKEVRGAALDQLISTLDPREKRIVRTQPTLVERFKSRDLPSDLVMKEKDAEAALAQMDAAEAQAAQIEQGFTQAKTKQAAASADATTQGSARADSKLSVDVAHVIAQIEKLLSEAKASNDTVQLAYLDKMLTGLSEQAGETNGAGTRTGTVRGNAKP